MTKRISITVSAELVDAINRHQQQHNLNSQAAAAADLIARGVESETGERIHPKAAWGGTRVVYYPDRHRQCPQCGGWNVGERDGVAVCADCGWHAGE